MFLKLTQSVTGMGYAGVRKTERSCCNVWFRHSYWFLMQLLVVYSSLAIGIWPLTPTHSMTTWRNWTALFDELCWVDDELIFTHVVRILFTTNTRGKQWTKEQNINGWDYQWSVLSAWVPMLIGQIIPGLWWTTCYSFRRLSRRVYFW